MKSSSITSTANTLVKSLIKGMQKRERGSGERSILLEGPHLLQAALGSGRVSVRHVFVLSSWLDESPEASIVEELEGKGAQIIMASEAVIRKLSSTVTPQGIVGAGAMDVAGLEDVKTGAAPFLIVSDGVRDPGNLGTMIRTADAAGADAVVLLPGSADPYSAKVLRASAGSAFNLPVVEASTEAFASWADDRGIRILAADAGAGRSIYDVSLLGPVSLVFGNEGSGLGPEIKEALHESFAIPISGAAESLNVTAAAAIAAFEVRRQRSREPGDRL